MKKIIFLFLFSAQMVFAQNPAYDSLLNLLLTEKEPAKKLIIQNELVAVAFNEDLNLALKYALQGVTMAEKSGDKNWQPKFYEMAGRMYANLLQLDSASFYFDKAFKGYEIINNKKGQATTLFKIAWVHKKKEDIEPAMKADLQALKLMEEIKDDAGIADAYNRITEDLNRQGRNKEAFAYALKTIELCKKNNFNKELAYAYSSASHVSISLFNHLAALHYIDSALTIGREIGIGDPNLSDFLNGRGNALKKLGRYKEAIESYKQAFDFAKKANYPNAISATIANLGEVSLLTGNYPEALKYQLETVRLQEMDKDLSNLTENYGHLSTIYEKLGDYKSALLYQKKARALRDSTASIESDKAMSKLLTQYETKKKEETISSQAKEISQQNKVQWLSIAVLALLAVFLLFMFISYIARSKANRLLAIKNNENELLLKEIHHRVKNNLEVVSSLLALQSAQIEDTNTKDAMQESQNRVQSIGIVHQKLYQGTNLGAIEMKDYFINLSESVLDSFGEGKRITINCAMEKLNLDIDTAVPLGLIVNELLTNTLKYAFPAGEKGEVKIKLTKVKDNVLHLEVSDNGIGKSAVTQGTGFGGQLVYLLTKQLNGSMKEDVEDGTRIFFEFDLKKAS